MPEFASMIIRAVTMHVRTTQFADTKMLVSPAILITA
jgi:hypothetical protein